VIEVNDALVGSEATINDSPYEGAWMVKIKLKKPAEIDALLSADAYRTEIGE
jgi:glycine cleavage system H protein